MQDDPNQPSPALVAKKAAQLFSPEELPSVMALLQSYGTQSWQRELDRVRLALLKLSNGSLESLRQGLEVAHQDYRDILAWAEYPNAMRLGFSQRDKEAEPEAREKDRKQYLNWLNSDGPLTPSP